MIVMLSLQQACASLWPDLIYWVSGQMLANDIGLRLSAVSQLVLSRDTQVSQQYLVIRL